MATPLERLTSILNSYTPSEVVFRASNNARSRYDLNSLVLVAVVVKDRTCKNTEEDTELALALATQILESWDLETGRYVITADVNTLWNAIKRPIINQYNRHSQRCNATKRKTEQFIRDIRIDEKALANFLIHMFLTITNTSYDNKSAERETYFDQLEGLRRTYGKRNGR